MVEILKNKLQPVNEASAVISMIERVALDKDADMNKLEKLLDMQERVLNRNAKQAFSADIAAMQDKLPRVAKKGQSHNGSYAKLEDINDTVRPALQAHGFGITFHIEQNALEWVKVTAILQHREGHSESTEIVLPLDKSGNKNQTQSVGSTISYGKRYSLCALLNISTGDDDDGGQVVNDLDKIHACVDMKQLQEVFKELWNKHKDSKTRQALTAAKDNKKKEFNNGTAN